MGKEEKNIEKSTEQAKTKKGFWGKVFAFFAGAGAMYLKYKGLKK